MKKTIKVFLASIFVFFAISFFLVGKIVDRKLNKCDHVIDLEISEETKILHQNIPIADLHADNLLWDRKLIKGQKNSQVDLPKLLAGNYTLQVFDAVIKTPRGINYESNSAEAADDITLLAMVNRWPIKTWHNLTKRAIHQSDILHRAERKSNGRLKIVKTKTELEDFISTRNKDQNKVAGILSIEGLHALEGNIDNLNVLYDAGYRMMGLVHFFDNKVGGSAAGEEKGGLTPFGREVVKRMEELEITIDLSHASPQLIKDVLEVSTRPIISSHGGVQGTMASIRNLSDDEIIGIANTGGLIGIGFWEEAVGSTHPDDIAEAIRYVVDLVGINHVALGSDYDGTVHVRFDASQIIVLTQALKNIGFHDSEIGKIMGGNVINYYLNNLPD